MVYTFINLNMKYSKYIQNVSENWLEHQVTCSKWGNLYVTRCEMLRRVWIWKGHHCIMFVALVIIITLIIAKNGQDKTSLEYYIWYTTRINFWCRFRIWSQNSKIWSVSCVITWFELINGIYGHMFQPLELLFLLSESSPICIYYDSKELKSKFLVLGMIETQQWDILILAWYHSFGRHNMASTIMQYIEHTTLHVYSKVQKSLP